MLRVFFFFSKEPELTNSEVSTLEENMNDPIGAVKKLGRVSLDCRRRQMLSFSLFRSVLFPLFHALPATPSLSLCTCD